MSIQQPTTSVKGRSLALSFDNLLLSEHGLCSGFPGRQVFLPSHERLAFWDDFDVVPETAALGNAVTGATGGRWASYKGSDAQAVFFTYTTDVNGIIVGTTGTDATATMAVTGTQLVRKTAPYKATSGDLYLLARLKISAITNFALFVGFTDLDGTTKLEMPIESAASANTITTTASDAVGVFFDDRMTADNFWLAGVKGDADATHVNLGLAPVADTYFTVALYINTSGGARAYIDGSVAGSAMSNAVTVSTAIAPVIAAYNTTTTGAPTVTVDYIAVSQLRT